MTEISGVRNTSSLKKKFHIIYINTQPPEAMLTSSPPHPHSSIMCTAFSNLLPKNRDLKRVTTTSSGENTSLSR